MANTDSEQALVARLLDLPPDEREVALHDALIESPELHSREREIRAALHAQPSQPNRAEVNLDKSAVARIISFALDASDEESSGSRIGVYKLLQQIGQGGFGVVWMAEQTEPIQRRVALKIIKRGMDTREVIARFETERQALAMMDHPNIAHVLDAGATANGRPYFAMELVRGVPITSYCNEQRLSIEQRLQLFTLVCNAVQHAHQKGVIHRDLKPSNILVTLHDGVPVPKIIDFGIAKATSGALTDRTLFTQFQSFLGTPVYTSPEQMEMSGLDVDTRSDIYSLGVLLYELLTGRPPHDPEELKKSSLEMMRAIIRERDPLLPSRLVDTLESSLRTTAARARRLEVAQYGSVLRGDLDWIVMRCLEKDRTRRYATASDLSGDIRHYLTEEPIQARPPSTWYRTGKFIRRHRLGVSAGFTVALALVAGTIVSTLALVRESAARRRETALHAEAEKAAARSDQIARFMKNMLAGIDPSVARGRDNTVLREILDATTQRVDAELRDQPEAAADLRTTLAQVYWSIGDFAKAESLVLQSIPVLRAAQPARTDDLASALHLLGRVLISTRRRSDAEPHVREAAALLEKAHGRRHLATADVLFDVAKFVEDDRSKFRATRQEVLDIYSELLPPEDPRLGNAIFGLGTATLGVGELDQAHELLLKALGYRIRATSKDHPLVAETWQSLGLCEVGLGRRDEAIHSFRNALDIRRRVLTDAHPEVVSTLLRLTSLTAAADEDPLVVEATNAVIAAQRSALPRTAPGLAIALLIHASFTEYRDHAPEQAAQMRTEAMQLLSRALNDGIPIEYRLEVDIGISASGKFLAGVPQESVALYEASIAICERSPPSAERQEQLMNAFWFRSLGLYWGGRFAEANDVFAQCLTPEAAVRVGPIKRQISHSIWSESLLASGRGDEAWALMKPFLPGLEAAPAPPPPGQVGTLSPVFYQIGRCALQRGDLALAEKAFKRARENADTFRKAPDAPGKYPFPSERFDSAYGLLRARQGNFDEAVDLCRTALTRIEAPREKKMRPPPHVIAEVRANLAEALRLARAADAQTKQASAPPAGVLTTTEAAR